MDRQAWLEERRKGIGASDIAAICGMSKYAGPLDIYLDKLGLLPPRESEPMKWGLMLEDVIAAGYEERTGRKTYPAALHIHPQHAWARATPDRVAADRLVELKTSRTSEGWGEEGTDEVPLPYLLQTQWQMFVDGSADVDVCVLIGGSDLRIYTVPGNRDLQAALFDRGEAFWRLVEARVPPDPDWSREETPKLLALLHRPTEGVRIELDESAWNHVRVWEEQGREIAFMESERKKLTGVLHALMGDAFEGVLPDGRIVCRKLVTVAAHQRKESTSNRITIKKGRE